jgi:hypothetical protein
VSIDDGKINSSPPVGSNRENFLRCNRVPLALDGLALAGVVGLIKH